jgi:hypothetical protein
MLYSHIIFNFDINMRKEACGKMLMCVGGGAILGRNFGVNIGRAAREACRAT